VEMRPQVSTLQ